MFYKLCLNVLAPAWGKIFSHLDGAANLFRQGGHIGNIKLLEADRRAVIEETWWSIKICHTGQ